MDDLPAILGGPMTRPQGPPTWPPLDAEILDVLTRAHRDGSWGRYQAEHSRHLEAFLREYLSVEHLLLCGSGTYAVELALRACQVGPGDEVLLASYEYPAHFFTIHALGATPVLVDVDPRDGNLSLEALAEAAGPKCRAVLASHLHGAVVPMRALMAWATEHNLHVVEDAAQVPGAMIQGRRAGAWGDVGVWSFGGSKLLTAGRGGAIFTNRSEMAVRARTHLLRAGNPVCPLSEMQAAVLLPQCRKLEERNRQRRDHVERLRPLLGGLPGVSPFRPRIDDVEPAYYKLGFQFDAEAFGLPRSKLVAAMRAEGIALDEGFPAAHVGRSPRRFRAGSSLAESERAHRETLVLHHPIFLEDAAAMQEVADAWKKIQRHAGVISE